MDHLKLGVIDIAHIMQVVCTFNTSIFSLRLTTYVILLKFLLQDRPRTISFTTLTKPHLVELQADRSVGVFL